MTRAGNSLGRAGMIAATGGLWALTPKKSKYKEKKSSKTDITVNKWQFAKTAVNLGKLNNNKKKTVPHPNVVQSPKTLFLFNES